jgi:hypothetical protein
VLAILTGEDVRAAIFARRKALLEHLHGRSIQRDMMNAILLGGERWFRPCLTLAMLQIELLPFGFENFARTRAGEER